MLAALVNGAPIGDAQHALSIEERGVAYGDGLFETMLLKEGQVRFLRDHIARLQWGCERLGIVAPSELELTGDIVAITHGHGAGIVKLIVTRGAGARGYRDAGSLRPSRIALLYPPLDTKSDADITVRWCTTRLSRNARLAGIKHLNRLENVLAQSEWRDLAIDEGVMLDTEGEAVCATAGNIFVVVDGALITPDLRFSGVRGVMRQRVLVAARQLKIETVETALRPEDVLASQELFVTNAVRGIRSVCALDDRHWHTNEVARLLASAIEKAL